MKRSYCTDYGEAAGMLGREPRLGIEECLRGAEDCYRRYGEHHR